MNILVVTAYPPVLQMHGGGVRMHHNIRILASRHRVHVLSFVENDEEVRMMQSLTQFCESVKSVRRVPDFRPHWLSVLPFMVREFSTPEMHRAVDATVRAQEIDVLQCEYLQMAQFRRRGLPCVLTAHEVLSKNAFHAFAIEEEPREKLRLFYRWMQMLRYEVAEVLRFNRVVTMTASDADYLKSYAPGADIRAIPIGIDPSEFSPLEEEDRPVTALFVGNFRHAPNIEAARFIAEQLAPRFPDIQFLLPGAHAPDDLDHGANVVFPGYIADIRTLYRRPDTIVLAPLFSGTGQRVKLLEAFSMACPVITTRTGAMGFPIENGVHAIVANTADEFESALRLLAGSRQLRRNLGLCARKMIEENFAWGRIAGAYLNVVETVGAVSDRPFYGLKILRTSNTASIKRAVGPRPYSQSDALRATFPWKKLLFPIKAVTFVWRFLILLVSTAYLEGSRVTRG